MNKQIRRLAIALMVCYLALFVQLNRLQVLEREELATNTNNNRDEVRDFDKPRGQIVSADGVVLAQSVLATDSKYTYQRDYPTGDLFANVTGYLTFAYGSTKVESKYSDVLTGQTSEQQLRNLTNLFSRESNTGSVHLTMRADLQEVAKDALGEREGSVVVIDTHTGAVVAMYSYPSYDPNLVAVHDNNLARDRIEFLNNYPGKPTLANAYQERYMPGSTFKVITTAIGLENGVIDFDSTWPNEREWTPPQTDNPIQNYNGTTCGGDLREVFRRSCNIPFAKLAVEIGPERMVAGTQAWGIGERIPFDLSGAVASNFGTVEELHNNLARLAIRGFGQDDDLMVPLHMAMVAATVANGGQMMKPYV
ncbi:MAG TPA: penicillin-binding transpeptidase domain-containing protein, partial [Ilumatobacteraceae bacterium]|nr:penicillin-binding transpeptidase domain-containing protein [Ilumatobacteraceae bacterium]